MGSGVAPVIQSRAQPSRPPPSAPSENVLRQGLLQAEDAPNFDGEDTSERTAVATVEHRRGKSSSSSESESESAFAAPSRCICCWLLSPSKYSSYGSGLRGVSVG